MGIKVNFVYNSIMTLSAQIVGLIVFPYVTRVLGVENFGAVGFADQTINYFVLFATFGILSVGTREIACAGDDFLKRSKAYTNMILFLLAFTIITTIVFLVVVNVIPRFSEYKQLFYIGAAKLIFTAFLLDWFYRGIEKFKYITLRNIFVNIAYIVSVFLFVRSEQDYITFFALTTATITVNSIINLITSGRYARFIPRSSDFLGQMPSSLKQFAQVGTYMLITSLYSTFNVIYLGLVSDDAQVGYYYAAIKLYIVVVGFFAAFSGVMQPRISNLLGCSQQERCVELIRKSFGIVFAVTLPLIAFTVIGAEDIIRVFSGDGYQGAVLPLRITISALLVVCISQIVAIQVYIPMRRDRSILHASMIGASFALVLNLLLVKKLGAVGSALLLLCCESAVTVFYIIDSRRLQLISFPWRELATSLGYMLIYIAGNLVIYLTVGSMWLRLGAAMTYTAASFLLIEVFLKKNSVVGGILLDFVHKLQNRR